jgi:hypothetical protein
MMDDNGYDGGVVEDDECYAKLRDNGHVISEKQMDYLMTSIDKNKPLNISVIDSIDKDVLENIRAKIIEIMERYEKGKL